MVEEFFTPPAGSVLSYSALEDADTFTCRVLATTTLLDAIAPRPLSNDVFEVRLMDTEWGDLKDRDLLLFNDLDSVYPAPATWSLYDTSRLTHSKFYAQKRHIERVLEAHKLPYTLETPPYVTRIAWRECVWTLDTGLMLHIASWVGYGAAEYFYPIFVFDETLDPSLRREFMGSAQALAACDMVEFSYRPESVDAAVQEYAQDLLTRDKITPLDLPVEKFGKPMHFTFKEALGLLTDSESSSDSDSE